MKLIVFDTETTGLEPQTADIIQIGAVYMPDLATIETENTFKTYVKPFSEYRSMEAMKINGISEKTLATMGVSPHEAIYQFYNWCRDIAGKDFCLAGWNVPFDVEHLKFMHLKCKFDYNFPWKLLEASSLLQGLQIFNLGGTPTANEMPIASNLVRSAKNLGLEVGDHKTHDALEDAYLTAEVIKTCFERLYEYGIKNIEREAEETESSTA